MRSQTPVLRVSIRRWKPFAENSARHLRARKLRWLLWRSPPFPAHRFHAWMRESAAALRPFRESRQALERQEKRHVAMVMDKEQLASFSDSCHQQACSQGQRQGKPPQHRRIGPYRLLRKVWRIDDLKEWGLLGI